MFIHKFKITETITKISVGIIGTYETVSSSTNVGYTLYR